MIRQLSIGAYNTFLHALQRSPLVQEETIPSLQAQLDNFANLNPSEASEAQRLAETRSQWIQSIKKARCAQKVLLSVTKAGTAFRANFDAKYLEHIPVRRVREEALAAKIFEGRVSVIVTREEKNQLIPKTCPYHLLGALLLLGTTTLALHYAHIIPI